MWLGVKTLHRKGVVKKPLVPQTFKPKPLAGVALVVRKVKG